ncbi:MAG TPA: GAF domain-containing protein [Actinomycetota bacterium]|nr:GAF domain-containing protein [Actinomycetota bacterium]
MLREHDALGAPADWYRKLADVFREVLSEQDLATLLERIATTLGEFVPYEAVSIYEADEEAKALVPLLVRADWSDELKGSIPFGEGITGWVAERREALITGQAHDDPHASTGNPDGAPPSSLIAIPLVAHNSVKGVLNIYRPSDRPFTEDEFELAKRFADAASLAIDNARAMSFLEQQSLSDPLTSLYNHRHFHERLREELNRASRARDSTSVLMFDIDDFKKVNDIHGHSVGDKILVGLADILRETVRGSDVPCRIGGEEFAVILPSCDAGDALGLASRLLAKVGALHLEETGTITISVGISQGPEHAMNPKELVTYAEAAMLTAKAKGGNRVVLFDDERQDRPGIPSASRGRDVRSVAYLKMLQSLGSKLNRLNNVSQIGKTIVNELRTLIDYHACRIYIAEDDMLVPIAAKGEPASEGAHEAIMRPLRFGEGVTGRAAETAKSLLIPNALECDFAIHIPGTDEMEESLVAVPLIYNRRVNGVVVISKLGTNQFREEDVRLLEVLAGQASVAMANARLYEAERREAEHAKSLLEFASLISKAPSFGSIGQETVRMAARLLEARQASLWLRSDTNGQYYCAAHFGYVGDPKVEPIIKHRIDGPVGERFMEGRRGPFVAAPSELELYFSPLPSGAGHSLAIAPLHSGHGLRGWLAVRHPSDSDGHFPDDQLRLLEGLSFQTSIAMQKAILYKEQKEDAEVANALLEFSRELAQAAGLEEVLARVVELSARILGSPKTAVWMQESSTGELAPQADWGYSDLERARVIELTLERSLAKEFLSPREPFIIKSGGIEGVEGSEFLTVGGTLAVAPMRFDSNVGCISVVAPAYGEYEFSEKKMRLLAGIADQAQLAIANAGSFESLERTFFETVEALANALEAKDEYTSTHARSITDMVLEVGAELGVEGRDLKRLELGALFHDIGKIGIPSDIIRKQGPLSEEEWDIMRTHPELGEKILAPIDRLADVRVIIRACHEHYDGGGYPDKLKGEDIPLEARIILTCDAYDAMTTDRPYRKRLPHEEAIRRLKEASGTQFDPRVVDAFLRCFEDKLAAAG